MKYIGLSMNNMFDDVSRNFITMFYFKFEKKNGVVEFTFSALIGHKNYDKIYQMMFLIDEIFKKVEPSEIDLMINLIKRMLKER